MGENNRIYSGAQYRALKIILGLEQCSLLWTNEKCHSTNLGDSFIISKEKKKAQKSVHAGNLKTNVYKTRRKGERRDDTPLSKTLRRSSLSWLSELVGKNVKENVLITP